MQRGRDQRGHRGQRGRRPQGQYRQTNINPEGLGYMKLKEWADLEDNPSDLLLYMTSYLPQISLFLNIDNINQDKFILFIRCLKTVWNVKFHDNNFQKILDVLVSTSFFTKHALTFLERSSGHARSPVAETVLRYVNETARRLPEKANCCYKVLCFINTNHVQLNVQVTFLNEVVTSLNSTNQRQQKQEKRKRSRWSDDDDPPDDIRDVSIYPTQEDFDADLTPYLRANKISGAFRDKNHYLDVMFRLLREDLIQPLRETIHQYRVSGKCKGDPGIFFYENVKILGLFVNDGVEHTLLLDKRQLNDINWDPKNHFMPGNLMCLSKNKFQTIFYAIVTRSEQRRDHVAVKFQNRLEEVYGLTVEDSFVMTESPSYFEGYRHVLEGLQEMVDSTLPFEPYLVRCKKEPSKPEYIYPGSRYDLKCLVKPEIYVSSTRVNVLQTNTWLNLKQVCLNDKQYAAVKSALTQEFTLLQGPPGTGKTYVSLKIMRTLLENQGPGVPEGSPILVVCYTNHALDQFLEGVLSFCPTGVVRVGGNQKCETLIPFNLRAIQQGIKQSLSTRNCLRDIHRSMNEVKRKILNLTNTVQVSQVEIQTEIELKEVIACSHYETLTNFHKNAQANFIEQFLKVKPGSLNNDVQQACEARLISLLWAEDFALNETRFQMYREWVLQYEGKFGPTNREGVLPLKRLRPFIPPEIIKNLSTKSISIKEWLFGKTIDAMLNVLENLLQFRPTCSLNDSEGEDDDVEDYDEYDEDDDSENDSLNEQCLDTSRFVMRRAMALGVSLTTSQPVVGHGGKKFSYRQVVSRLQITQAMSESDEKKVVNVWQLNIEQRFQLYKLWISRAVTSHKSKIKELTDQYESLLASKREIRQMQDIAVLKTAKVVGMTTTGAAKHRKVLQAVGPRIVVIEEAAEVLESHIITALSEQCQHLILIGDHQQLRPKTQVYELAKDYGLDVSLFERQINNQLHCVQLSEQRRMRPEISIFLRHIYPNLTDSESVKERPHIKGMDKSVFFIKHNNPEKNAKNSASKQNSYEAKYLVKLCEYLVVQGYLEEEITILATYGGQVSLLSDLVKQTKAIRDVRVSTVDNYQGEENVIILLSLVRSNKNDSVGFLKTDNRVCVALSRARFGMYVIGDIDLLSGHSVLWSNIHQTAVRESCVGRVLELRCPQHSRVTEVKSWRDFETGIKTGGCGQLCNTRLVCGHICTLVCHVIEHDQLTCVEPCLQYCPRNHRCTAKCNQKCPKCTKMVDRVLPCGHQVKVLCYTSTQPVVCRQPCQRSCSAGHLCRLLCSEACQACRVQVSRQLQCGHVVRSECHDLNVACDQMCEKKCHRGHKCLALCKTKCPPCSTIVAKRLPCQHILKDACHIVSDGWNLCEKPCEKSCPRGHPCTVVCGKPCVGCPRLLPCGHPCSELPGSSKSDLTCSKPCLKICQKGHSCPATCNQTCHFECEKVLPCGHKCKSVFNRRTETSCFSMNNPARHPLPCGHSNISDCQRALKNNELVCNEPCESLCERGHGCLSNCDERCLPCGEMLGCGHRCASIPSRGRERTNENMPCEKSCLKVCRKGHLCQLKCNEPCPRKCKKVKCRIVALWSDHIGFKKITQWMSIKHNLKSKAKETEVN